MFWILTLKELKLIFKNVTFYLFIAVVILFYITQYGESVSVSTKKPVQPLSEMQFMYLKMVEDYHDGKLTNKGLLKAYEIVMMNSNIPEDVEKRFDKANDYVLNDKEKAALKSILDHMNPEWEKTEQNIFKIRFRVSAEEYRNLMKQLDASLGGYTYYYDENAKTPLLAVENSYGVKEITDPREMMKSTCYQLKTSIITGNVMYYRFHLGINKHLNDAQKLLIKEALLKIVPNGVMDAENPSFLISYKECSAIIRELDNKLGVDMFEKTLEEGGIHRSLTYEEAMADFKKLLGKDRLTNAYARCLADYMGITAGFLPVFLAGFVLTRDRRSRMDELIYSRPVSSYVYVMSKFLAISLAALICYLGIAAHSTFIFVKQANTYGYQIDNLAFFTHILTWVMPTVLFTTSLGLMLSVLFRNGIAAVVIQLILWFSSMMPLEGDYGLTKFIVRFNAVVPYEKYESWFSAIAVNRIFFTLISFGLAAAASAVLSWRRSSGNGYIPEFLKNRSI